MLLICMFLIVDFVLELFGSNRDPDPLCTSAPITEFEASESDVVTFEHVDIEPDTDPEWISVAEVLEQSQSEPAKASRPLPTIEIHRPTADRGADDVRERLDGKRCVFCDVPVGDDEEFIETDMFGMLVVKPICKGHSEHPDSWLRARRQNAEKMGYCPSCGDVTLQDQHRRECSTCDPVDLETPNDRRL